MRALTRGAAAAVCGVLIALTAGSAVPALAEDPLVYEAGHLDILDAGLEDGALDLLVHDEDIDEEFEPADVLLVVKGAAKTTVPAGGAYSFLGASGSPVWILPQVQDPAILWPGIATEEVPEGAVDGDAVTFRLISMAGPGRLAIYSSDPFGNPTVLLNTGDAAPDTMTFPVGTHAHANWAFTAAGAYTFTFRAEVTIGGQLLASEPKVYTIRVDDAAASTAKALKQHASAILASHAAAHPAIARAAAKVDQSLASQLWLNDDELRRSGGDRVFGYELEAIAALALVREQHVPAPVRTAINEARSDLVRADRRLAVVAVDRAAGAGARPGPIALARQLIAQGDAAAAASREVVAIGYYWSAWRIAVSQ